MRFFAINRYQWADAFSKAETRVGADSEFGKHGLSIGLLGEESAENCRKETERDADNAGFPTGNTPCAE